MICVKMKDCGAIVIEVHTAISPNMNLIDVLKKCREELDDWIRSLNARVQGSTP